MNKFILLSLVLVSNLFCANPTSTKEKKVEVVAPPYNPNFECSVLDDEDSIICEFEVIRDPIHEQNVSMTWINPNGEISRARDMVIPAGDTSAYDYRYLEGRETGKWSFKILYNQKEYTTQFDLKK